MPPHVAKILSYALEANTVNVTCLRLTMFAWNTELKSVAWYYDPLSLTSSHMHVFIVCFTVWCLDFQYTVNGNSHGRLKVYMAVNGKKGSPLLTRYGTASSDVHWFREQLYIHAVAQSPSDMIEVCQ